jgi:hypothetical protein
MIITKVALPRRTFLRGIGATLALPLLDAMVPALSAMAKTAATPVRRLGFFYIPNGANMERWTPKADGRAFEFSPTLKPLEPFRNQVVVVSGLDQQRAENLGEGVGEHARASAVWLNGVRPKRTEGADVQAGVTADQLAAREIGADTPLTSLELALEPSFMVGNCDNGYSCVYMNTLSWRTETTPLPMENNPRLVFERMFGDGGSSAERRAEMTKDRSILDSVTADMARLQKSLGRGDRARVSEYVDGIREVERRIQRAEAQSAESTLPTVLDRPVGIPETFDEHARLMYDLQALAFQADITRVITFQIGREFSPRTFPNLGVTDGHHTISHHQNNPERLDKYAKINTYHLELFAYFLDKLRSTPDGDGSLLDHSLLLYGGGISDGDKHSHLDLPLVLVGGSAGRVQGGRHVRYASGTPMNNLLLSILDKVGVRTERFGDATGQLKLDYLSDV